MSNLFYIFEKKQLKILLIIVQKNLAIGEKYVNIKPESLFLRGQAVNLSLKGDIYEYI